MIENLIAPTERGAIAWYPLLSITLSFCIVHKKQGAGDFLVYVFLFAAQNSFKSHVRLDFY